MAVAAYGGWGERFGVEHEIGLANRIQLCLSVLAE